MPRVSKGKGGSGNGGDHSRSEGKGGDLKPESKAESKSDSKGEADKADAAKGLIGDKTESSTKGSGNSSQSPSVSVSSDEMRGAVGGAPASSEERVQGLLGELFRNIKDIQVSLMLPCLK